MKNLILLSAIIVFSLTASGQTIVNGNFEGWTAMPIDQLPGWSNSNLESLPKIGKLSCFKATGTDAHSGSYALKLQTVSNGVDTVGAYTLDAPNPNSNNNFIGGVPYSSQPTKITGYYKYSSPGNDAAGMLVIFKKGGTIISLDTFKLGPVSAYTSFSFNLSLGSTPDSMIIGIVSSHNIINNNNYSTGEIPGSTLYMDDLAFTGSGTMPPIPGGSFENWTTTNIESPDGWQSNGDPGVVSQTTESYKGLYAVKLEENTDGGETSITNGTPTHNGSPTGGAPYTGTKDTLIGYYKFVPVKGDVASVDISFSKNGSNIYSTSATLTPASSYTMFSIPYSLISTPDKLRIEIGTRGSGSSGSTGHAGTTLIMDEMTLKSEPLHTGIEGSSWIGNILKVYPNPASNNIIFQFSKSGTTNNSMTLKIFNSLGELVFIKDYSGNTKMINLDISSYKNGIYNYNFVSGGSFIKGNFVKE